MHRTLSSFMMVLAGPALLLPAPVLRSQEVLKPNLAYLRVYLPADAKLVVDGYTTKQTGEMRRFVSPPLQVGKGFIYTLKATWKDKGKEITREREARVEAGKETAVDLRKEEPKKEGKGTESKPPKKDGKGTEPKPTKKDEEASADPDRKPDVVYWPTPQNVVDRMLEMAEVKKGDVVYDLGCGDARILVTAAKKYGAKGFGYDIDPARIKDSLENVQKNHVEDLVTIKKADIFTLDLKDATVVTLYLLPDLNVRLMPQLEKLKPGTRIVSHDFDMKGAKPKKVEKIRAMDHMGFTKEHEIYLWIVPWDKE